MPLKVGCYCDITVTLEPALANDKFNRKMKVTFRDGKTVLELIAALVVY
jgi:hypothetical protein